ncbi:MAG: PilZ domain-containing protein [Spirochaetia bacterium]|jgi:c-di-GMP-binding flagellar brake protein YcgR|nr:PilZ domain-containing protein [Spirochaetia bacterium]
MINSLFLLQANFALPTADTKTIYITLGIFGVFVIFIIIGSLTGRRGASASGAGASRPLSSRAGKKRFKKIAKNLGLTTMQTKLLEDIAAKYRISSPIIFISSPNVFNTTMKKAVRDYDSGAYAPDVKENYKLMLFTIKQKLDRNSGTGKKIGTSRQLTSGKQINITTSNGAKYTSQILTNLKDSICVTIPMQPDGTLLRLNKWENVSVSLFEKGDRGYTFASKVMGYTTMKNTAAMMLQHSSSISTSKQRYFPRKELGKPCYFYKITIATVGSGKSAVRKAVVNDPKGKLGTVVEISAGGCSIRAGNYLNRGELLKVDIGLERKTTMTALGKVVNLRKEGMGNNVMHIQFTKMTKKNMNSINSYVYGIEEKESILDY